MKTKAILAVALAALMLAASATAGGITVTYMQGQTKLAVNKRLRFLGEAVRVVRVRCQRDTTTQFFCIVRLTDGEVANYIAKLNFTTGDIYWTLQR